MRKSLVLATFVVLACSAVAFAGVPDPSRCSAATAGSGCSYGLFDFQSDGSRDKLTLRVTLRDAFDAPVAGCTTSCNLGNFSNTGAQCGGNRKTAISSGGGALQFIYNCIGGRGTCDLLVTAHCAGGAGLNPVALQFTSTDLNNNNITNIVDLGIWVGYLGAQDQLGDYNCSNVVNIVDLGLWVGGANETCALCP
jgi:hypothetical protein